MVSSNGEDLGRIRAPGTTTRRCPSWIEGFVDLTSELPSPEIFCRWSAIATVGAALERRVYVRTSKITTYPNMFVLLVGRPGVGKTHALNEAANIARLSGNVRVGPSDLTKQALLDYLLSEDVRKRTDPLPGDDAPFHEYHSLALYVGEFGTMFRSQDQEMLSTLNDLWDCPTEYSEKRRYRGKTQPPIPHPQVSILAGTATRYLSTIFPPEAWDQGFMARVILIYSGEQKPVPLFPEEDEEDLARETRLRGNLIKDLSHLGNLKGQMRFTVEAREAFELWVNKGMVPAPNAPRLQNYNTRRIAHIQKLMMIASAARSDSMEITVDDLTTAMNWLFEAETAMPNVFLEMSGRSDVDVIRDIHHMAWAEYLRNGRKALHKARLMYYLSSRAPADRVHRILDLAVASHVFKREAGHDDLYIPQPIEAWGI